jgi:hypothetical protein
MSRVKHDTHENTANGMNGIVAVETFLHQQSAYPYQHGLKSPCPLTCRCRAGAAMGKHH